MLVFYDLSHCRGKENCIAEGVVHGCAPSGLEGDVCNRLHANKMIRADDRY